MNLQQQERFYQMMTRLRANSRAASSGIEKEDKIITEVVDGLIVSKPAKRIEYLSTNETTAKESEPIVIDLQQKSKAGSAPGINKLQEIIRFQRSNGRRL